MFFRTAGQFKTSYLADQALFPVKQDAFLLGFIMVLAWVIFPLTASEFTFQTLLIPILIYSLAAMGLNILTGYAGQLSLGTAAFMGVGAYACYKMVTIMPWMNPVVAILLSGVFSAGIGVDGEMPATAATRTEAATQATDGACTAAETSDTPSVITSASSPRGPNESGRRVCTPQVCIYPFIHLFL